MSTDDRVYFKRRANQELHAATAAASEDAAAIHRKLASRYLQLAGEPIVKLSSPADRATA